MVLLVCGIVRRLRDHPDVVLELKRFWKFISQEPDASFMLKSNYIEMHICMFVVACFHDHQACVGLCSNIPCAYSIN